MCGMCVERRLFRRLGDDEFVLSFNCGEKYSDLNDFIINDAPYYRKELLAVSYVIEDSDTISAYFSLANDRIGIEDFESNNIFNRFRKKTFLNSKRIKHYPAVKLCRLGVSVERQSSGLGSLILDAIKWYFLDDNKTGCRYITVDAHRDAVPFYLKNGFKILTESEDSPNDRTCLMYYDLMALKLSV